MKKLCTMLLVDDDQDYKYFFSMALEKADEEMHLVTAADGVEALARIRELKPDIVVLDFNMPNMNGLTFLKELRKSGGAEHPRLVVYSTFLSMVDEKELLSLGAEKVFTKPATFLETVEIIRGIISGGGEKKCA